MSVSERPYPYRPYNVMHDQQISGTELPSPDDLEKASSALGAVHEFFTEPTMMGVAKRVLPTDNPRLDDADVGRLLIWVDHMREQARYIMEDVEKVAVIVHESWHNDPLPIREDGLVTDRTEYATLRRRISFDA
jgi:hypothetical protein